MTKKERDFYRPRMVQVARHELAKKRKEESLPEELVKKFYEEVWTFLEGQREKQPVKLLAPFESKPYLSFQGVEVAAYAGDTIEIGRYKQGFLDREPNKIVISVDGLVRVDSHTLSRYYKQYLLENNPYGYFMYQILGGEKKWSSVGSDPNAFPMMQKFFGEVKADLRHGGPSTG